MVAFAQDAGKAAGSSSPAQKCTAMQGGGPQWTSEIWYGPGDTTGFPYAPKPSAINLHRKSKTLSVDCCVEIIPVQIPHRLALL